MSRLIDADALKRKAQRVATESWKMGLTARIETTLNQFIDWIDNAPTVQPEPTQEIQDILDYLDTVLHPIVSPEHLDVYSRLHDMISSLPYAQPDEIPLEWIDKHLEWLDNCDNDFAQLAKVGIKAMVELWKKDGSGFCSEAKRKKDNE